MREMIEYSLRNELERLVDPRRGQGQRHRLDVVLMVTIMATMSGYVGYRAIGDFASRYKKELVSYLDVAKNRIPSIATIRRVLMDIDHLEFEKIFQNWTYNHLHHKSNEWISIDGKAIKGTKQKEEDKKLAHLVSFFKNDSKEVLCARKTANKSNEIPLVQEMIESFDLEGFIFTMDAMHCQKETLKKNTHKQE